MVRAEVERTYGCIRIVSSRTWMLQQFGMKYGLSLRSRHGAPFVRERAKRTTCTFWSICARPWGDLFLLIDRVGSGTTKVPKVANPLESWR